MDAQYTGPLSRGYRAEVAFDGERRLDDGALVLVDGTTITAVEPAGTPDPPGYAVQTFPDATLLPGLIDTHVHLCGDGGPRALDQLTDLSQDRLDAIVTGALAAHARAGVTTVRDLGDIDWHVASRRDTRAGYPRIVAAGPPITKVGGHCANMGGGVAGADALVAAVGERAERGVDVVKIMLSGGLMTPGTDVLALNFALDEVRTVVDAAHRHGLPVIAHAHPLVAVEQAIAAGIDGIEHCTCFVGTGMRTTPELARRIVDAGIVVCPTLGRSPGVQIPERTRKIMRRLGLDWDDRLDQVAVLHEAGVRLIAGTDGGINPVKPHAILPEALIAYVQLGMSPAAALASATGQATDACRLTDTTGRLRPGLAADVLVVAGDATREVSALRHVLAVVARGVPVIPA